MVFAAVGLLATGCSGTPGTPAPSGEADTGQNAVQSQTNAQVQGADDAANLIEKASVNAQNEISAGDDADLITSDSADFNSLTEVQNGY